MLSNRLAVGALAVACIAAAAGGGYLATRQNAVPVPALAAVTPAPATAPAPAVAPSAQPAQSSDAAAAGPDPKQSAVSTPAAPVSEAAPKAAAEKNAPQAPEPRANRSRVPAGQVARRDPPASQRTWPSEAAAQTPIPAAAPLPVMAGTPPADASATEPDDHAGQDQARAAEPPQFEELVVPPDSVIGLQTDASISSERARVEDRVDGRVTRDVRVNNHVAIPAGTRAIGTVVLVERGGKFKERARLGIRFNTLVLADGTRLPISTETIYREGDTPSSASKVGGGAIGGAILGAILGGGKGAVVGGMAGAGAGSAAVMAGDRNAAVLPAGATMTVRMLAAVTVTLDK